MKKEKKNQQATKNEQSTSNSTLNDQICWIVVSGIGAPCPVQNQIFNFNFECVLDRKGCDMTCTWIHEDMGDMKEILLKYSHGLEIDATKGAQPN